MSKTTGTETLPGPRRGWISNMKTTLMALTAVMISGVASANSTFQDTGVSLEGFVVKLGLAFPVDNTLKNNLTSNINSLGLEFAISSSYAKSSEAFLGLDYYGRNIGEFAKGSFTTVTYNTRLFKEAEGSRRSYTILGLGLGFANISQSDTVYLVRGGVGKELSDHTFIEAIGSFSTKTANDGSFNTIGLYFGYRF
jgi:hypothetical protein